jgi:hypothetical protein
LKKVLLSLIVIGLLSNPIFARGGPGRAVNFVAKELIKVKKQNAIIIQRQIIKGMKAQKSFDPRLAKKIAEEAVGLKSQQELASRVMWVCGSMYLIWLVNKIDTERVKAGSHSIWLYLVKTPKEIAAMPKNKEVIQKPDPLIELSNYIGRLAGR